MNEENPHRHSIRLPEYDYSQPGAYFITIAAHKKQHLFGEVMNDEMHLNEFGRILQQVWGTLPSRYPEINLGPFVIMPNHFHGIIEIHGVGAIHELPLPVPHDPWERRKMTIPLVVGYFKMNTAKSINLARQTPAQPVWQRNYYEHIIRNEDEYLQISEYILANPVMWAVDSQ